MAFLKHKDGYPWQASSEHNSSRASSISLHSSKTGESRQAISRLVFAFFIAGELAGQTECIAMLAGQAQKGPHDFCSFLFRTWFAMGPRQTWFGKDGMNPGSIHVPWDNIQWESLAEL